MSFMCFFFKQKTAYEMRISDWSSDVCSSDLKVELVAICAPEESDAEHERMVQAAEGILQALNLPYRKMLLCSGDMGFGARKTYDPIGRASCRERVCPYV